MARKRIMKVIKVGDIGVPVDGDGRYLDWKKIRGDYADVLTSPYGPRHFTVGDDTARIVLDFAVLPNGYYVLSASCEPDDLDLHIEDRYCVHSADKVPEAAYYLTQHVIEVIGRRGVRCEKSWEFAKVICEHASQEPFRPHD